MIAQLVETMRALAGAHPGFRPVHAKGLVCAGTFRGTREARGISRAPHLQGQAVPTIMRFSNAHGDPDVHDGLANPRALAVKFQLPDGQSADILANSIEGFPARTPEDLLAAAGHLCVGVRHPPQRIWLNYRVHTSQGTECQCLLRITRGAGIPPCHRSPATDERHHTERQRLRRRGRHHQGPTGGKLRYPARSSNALSQLALDARIKHRKFFPLCPEPALFAFI